MIETEAGVNPTDATPPFDESEPLAPAPLEESKDEAPGDGEPAATGSGWIGRLIPGAVVGIVLLWSYWAELAWCWSFWWADPNYSHGFLVIPVAIWILWRRLREPGSRTSHPWQTGWVLLLALLITRVYLYDRGYQWSAAASLLPVLLALALTLGGLRFVGRAWPALGYLVFLLPLPPRLNGLLAQPLQNLATSLSVILLKISGLWVLAEGNIIFVGKDPIMVAEACNGLSMMMTLAATVAAAMFLLPASVWVRIILGLSIVPIALVSNVLRITATAWCVQRFGAEIGGRWAHDVAGWLMMPLAFVLVLSEMKLLSWLIVEEVVSTEPLLLGCPISKDRGDRERSTLSKPLQNLGLMSVESATDGSGIAPLRGGNGDGPGVANAGNT